MIKTKPCNSCQSTGKLDKDICADCHGIGFTAVDEQDIEYFIKVDGSKNPPEYTLSEVKSAPPQIDKKAEPKNNAVKQIGKDSGSFFTWAINVIFGISGLIAVFYFYISGFKADQNVIYNAIIFIGAWILINLFFLPTVLHKSFNYLKKILWLEPYDLVWAINEIRKYI